MIATHSLGNAMEVSLSDTSDTLTCIRLDLFPELLTSAGSIEGTIQITDSDGRKLVDLPFIGFREKDVVD